MAYYFQAKQLCVGYQNQPLIQNIEIELKKGEILTLIGPNGAGKSTILKSIARQLELLGGSVLLEDKNLQSLSGRELAKKMAVVFTKRPHTELMTCEDVVATGRYPYTGRFGVLSAKDHEAVQEAMEAVHVLEFKDRDFARISDGQRQRILLARAICQQPEILLLDEPLAHLDPATGKRAIDLIDRICRERDKTVIIIEHRLEDALYRDVDRIVVIGDGRVVADMTPDELLASDILIQEGIREPLYVTALKHAGCQVAAKDHPQHIETMNLEPYQEKVRDWFEKVSLPEIQGEEKPALEVLDLDFSYITGKPILSDIHFRINKGEMLAIVGKNGAGKSTLSNLICGFIHPDHGKILLNGSDIADKSIKERGEAIGLVMQNPNQMISKPMIFDEVALGLRVRGVPEEEVKERVYDKLKICGLYPFRNWPVSALSFGQKKRVTIASILVMNPEILILDEPTAGQDYRHYTEIMEFLKHLNETLGITIIMITHDMHLMLEYTDRAIVIADGELIADDKPARVLTDEAVADRAYLKKTSLYDLAVRCGIGDASGFAERFIYYERQVRADGGQNSDVQ